jgi:class 3 adenylate cyclase
MAVTRKTVTVLFADVADSTGLGERLDPESVRGVMSRWFDEAKQIVERHGGTVEKFIGDAVMAVFGVPQLHEDDALRAVRAASELRRALSSLNDELERTRGVTLAVRVGLNTGEVVAGDVTSSTLVTGDAVNVAKRLEEAATANEVLVGVNTHRLTRAAAHFEPVGPLSAKGKTGLVEAWRLVAIDRDGQPYERRLDTPLVGRELELEQLRRAYGRALAERTCNLFTLLGPAGIGKSRLAAELFEEVSDEATVLVGRCLPYGDGITFWPLTQVLEDIGDDETIMQLLAGEEDGELVFERLCGVTGRGNVASQETFWAMRRICETLAHRRPLVICFEDVHWAEPTFLDLIEYLAGWVRDAPILLLCIARPEFLDERPTWLSGRDSAASITLTPLSAADADTLLDELGVDEAARPRIAEAAEGNPLYAEQMAAMLAEGGYSDGLFTIPPTIHALLAARLDRLPPEERRAIERAAVCGKEFWRDAIVALSPAEERDRVGPALMSLVRKELIKPGSSTRRADDGFRFRHALIRDAAYAGIAKSTRATLHLDFATWLEGSEADGGLELDELLGYHFEQAHDARVDVGQLGEETDELGARASRLLAQAGNRALDRRDVPAARTLLERSAALLTLDAPERPAVLTHLGIAVAESGEPARADAFLAQAVETAEALGDESAAARARVERAALLALVDPAVQANEVRQAAETAVDVFADSGDDAGLATALMHLADVHWMRCQYGEMQLLLERALVHAERAGASREVARILGGLCRAAVVGPQPVPEGIELCRSIERRPHGDAALTATTEMMLAVLEAMRGNGVEARRLYVRSREQLGELGLTIQLASQQMYAGWAELILGDSAAAERELRIGYELLEAMGETSYLSTTAAFLSHALYERGSIEEARDVTVVSENAASADDLGSQVLWRGVRAKIDARAGDPEAADIAGEAVRLARETDFVNLQAGALADLAEALKHLGRGDESQPAVAEAIRLYEAKGNVASAERLRLATAVA